MRRNLLILGAGGHGKVVLDVAESMRCYETIHFLDDGKEIGEEVLGHQVVGKITECHLHSKDYTDAIVALGNNEIRLELTKKLKELGYHVPTLVHPTSVVSQYTTIKEGTVIMPQAVINADAKIGKACIINTGAIIEHDCIVGDGSHIAYRAVLGGEAKVGCKVLVDIGAMVGRNIEIRGEK
ncbi:MAG: NeuD/PglB/VioB family sugar acetyltransferase [Zhenhengia sp.]|uniref:NeuD/PglB/VioB family sugar acetyltransferase n=1 Tax=Zhenhengia sp. TaxID=2944208 RepID=UPI0039956594